MVVRIGLALAIVWLVICVATRQTEAKLPGYIITGGELGSHAMYFAFPNYASLDQGTAVSTRVPDHRSGPAYDIYQGGVIYDYVRGERAPAYRYYPAERAVEDWRRGESFGLAPERAGELDRVIETALTELSNDELEVGVLSSALRASRLSEARMWLGPEDRSNKQGPAIHCPCAIPAGRMERWIMRDLHATLNGESHTASGDELPDVQIMMAFPAQEGYGWFGHYALPHGEQPGRLWLWPNPEPPIGQPYVETSRAFDSVIADALSQYGGSSPDAASSSSPRHESARGNWVVPTGVLAAGAVVLLADTVLARRRLIS